MDRIFKRPFSMAEAIAQDRKSCQFLFCLMKNPLLCRSARSESGREAHGRVRYGVARSTSEHHRKKIYGAADLFLAPAFLTLFVTNAEVIKKTHSRRKEYRICEGEKWPIRSGIELIDATISSPQSLALPWLDRGFQHQNRSIYLRYNRVLFLYCVTG
jgi:hypothetical protein